MAAALAVWDLTIPEKSITVDNLKERFEKIAKKWCFQLEKGEETGYMHYQCRISLQKRKRESQMINMFQDLKARVMITSTPNMGNDFYVMKEETRVAGPWKDEKPEFDIPEDLRSEPKWRPWQQSVIDRCEEEADRRTVNVIIDTRGSTGKSTLARWMCVHGKATWIPPVSDAADVAAQMMDRKETGIVFLDLPRALPKKHLNQMYTAIESIKDGYVYDKRYKYREKWLRKLHLWVFTNTHPDKQMLSLDRWKVFHIDSNSCLQESQI